MTRTLFSKFGRVVVLAIDEDGDLIFKIDDDVDLLLDPDELRDAISELLMSEETE